MTDRELLELAAKAAGIEIQWIGEVAFDCTNLKAGKPTYKGNMWNPLTDDGDALRLAVKLELHITNANGHAWASSKFHDATEPYGADRQAATRLAIVRSAAVIGNAM